METFHSFEGCHPKIGKISDAESQFPELGIGVTLLAGLCSFQTVTDKLNLFLSFSKYIRPEHLAFSGLGLVERGPTLPSI
jgi:hypothetical protein